MKAGIEKFERLVADAPVLAQPEMEKRSFPLVKVPPLRGGDF